MSADIGASRAALAWPGRVLVTGGAGFIGTNLVRRLAACDTETVVFDNLSRPYARSNAEAMVRDHPDAIRVVEADVRDGTAVAAATAEVDAIVHLAAQTAVTRSIEEPLGDVLDNSIGTVNVLEAARRGTRQPAVLFASTNKVYGDLADVATVEEDDCYRFAELPYGIDEKHPLSFRTPYGCSKGAADQYVLDYAHTFGLPTVVFRQSCIYGPHQFGGEEQGWLAWFVRAALSGQPLTIFGDGKQVRDLLHVDDLIEAFGMALARIDVTAGRAYNIGGGVGRCASVWWQLRPLLEAALGHTVDEPSFAPWRPGDQRVFVADVRRAATDFGWQPTIAPADGLSRLVAWFRESEPWRHER